MQNTLKRNKNWNMIMEDKKLFITRGADEIYFLDEAKDEMVSPIFCAYENDNWDNLAANKDYDDIIRILKQTGFIYKNQIEAKKDLRLSIQYFGDESNKLSKALQNMRDVTYESGGHDLLLIIRTNSPLIKILDSYSTIEAPHLFIDLAYCNTISIGPLVYKGETACLSCFVGRLATRWGDPPPPEEPYASTKTELIVALIQEKVEEYLTYGNCPDLINNVWSFNTKHFSATFDGVHKLPWCPVCSRHENEALSLSWVT